MEENTVNQAFPFQNQTVLISEDAASYALQMAALQCSLDEFLIVLGRQWDAAYCLNEVYPNFPLDTYEFNPSNDNYYRLRGTALLTSLRRDDNNIDIVRYLCEHHPDCAMIGDLDGVMPLFYGVYRHSSWDVYQMLLNAYPEAVDCLTVYGENLAHWVARATDADPAVVDDICLYYPELFFKKNEAYQFPLHLVAAQGTLASFQLIMAANPDAIFYIDHPIDPCNACWSGTPVHHAAMRRDGNADIFRYICEVAPDSLEIINDAGEAPLVQCDETMRRRILRFRPELDRTEYRRLNWEHRRVAMWVAVGTVTVAGTVEGGDNADIDYCLRMIGQRGPFDMFREVISFL
jgi:hypothetical protein